MLIYSYQIIIQINYSSVFSDGTNGLEYLIKKNDILIDIKKENKQIKILMRLYDGKKGLLKNEINLSIPFCEGNIQITDSTCPKLVAIKED